MVNSNNILVTNEKIREAIGIKKIMGAGSSSLLGSLYTLRCSRSKEIAVRSSAASPCNCLGFTNK